MYFRENRTHDDSLCFFSYKKPRRKCGHFSVLVVQSVLWISPLQGHVVRNWKVRWFVLLQDKLLYYKIEGGKKEPSPKGRILLDGCTITCPCLEYENRPVWLEKCISSLCHSFSNFFLSFLLQLLQPSHWGASRIRPSQKQAATGSVTRTGTELPHCAQTWVSYKQKHNPNHFSCTHSEEKKM